MESTGKLGRRKVGGGSVMEVSRIGEARKLRMGKRSWRIAWCAIELDWIGRERKMARGTLLIPTD